MTIRSQAEIEAFNLSFEIRNGGKVTQLHGDGWFYSASSTIEVNGRYCDLADLIIHPPEFIYIDGNACRVGKVYKYGGAVYIQLDCGWAEAFLNTKLL